MPTYQYTCTACGHQLEAVQSFTDDPLTVCPACEGQLRKLFSSVGVVFKGSGFYRTDSRNDAKGSTASGSAAKDDSSPSKSPGTKSESTSGSTSESTSSPAKSDSKPAVAATAS